MGLWTVDNVYLLLVGVPKLDRPVCRAGEESSWVDFVPLDSVHRHGMSLISKQMTGPVGGVALVDGALFCAHKHHEILLLHEHA